MDEELYLWGRRIRAFRKLKRLTQKELAEALHVSVSVLGAVERGDRQPTKQFLAEVAEALDIDINELLQHPIEDIPRKE